MCNRLAYASVIAVFFLQTVHAATPTAEEMWRIIQQQQTIIEQLQQKLEMTEQKVEITEQKVEATEQKVVVTEQKVEETQEEIEAAAEAIETASGSGGSGWWNRTSVGGYGELHYNNQEGDDEVDFHRFVLYFGHEFTDGIRFFSELELEHALAGDGKPGEVELEQAWLEFDLTENHRLRAGLDILPIGLVNYTHEPNTFYGVERPNVETRLIPAAWWEAGIGFNGDLAPGWNYHVLVHSGLAVPGNGTIRSGRQKVAEANADHPAFTGRLLYTGIPGLEVGGSLQYQSDIQAGAGAGSNSATLFEGHVDWRHGSGLGLRALYVRWDIDNVIRAGTDDDERYGYYIEPAYRFPLSFVRGEAGLFARWSGLDRANDREEDSIQLGMNYWPTDNAVFKFDWTQVDDTDADTTASSFNLGLGYQF